MSWDVFISYAREDSAVAQAIVKRLERGGIRCWIDSNTIAHQHGYDWADEIVAALNQCRMMVLVFSRHANASRYVKSEVQKAFERDLQIIPFRIEDILPEGSLDLRLPASQWLNAFPVYQDHLENLAASVCSTLDDPKLLTKRPVGEHTKVGWWPRALAHLRHHFRRAVQSGDTAVKTQNFPPKKQAPGGHSDRNALLTQIRKEDLRGLLKSNRWWRIKELIELLEAHELPLGDYAEAKAPLEKRRAAVQKIHDAAMNALGRVGPADVAPYLDKMRDMIADHPDIDALAAKIKDLTGDRGSLRGKLESLSHQGRWTGIENAVRTFALGNGQVTGSLLQAADKASQNAIKETRRFDLLAWTILGGAAILAASYCVESGLGISNGTFAGQCPDSWKTLVVPAGSVIVRFGTVLTTVGFLLAAFGVRKQGAFAGASIGLLIIAASFQAIPWALALLPGSTLQASLASNSRIKFLPVAVFSVAIVSALQFAACRLIGAGAGLPGMTAGVAAVIASHGLMPVMGTSNSFLASPNWSRWLPDAFACAALLTASGAIRHRRTWWLFAASAVGLGVVGPVSQQWSSDASVWSRSLPVLIGLIVAGWMAIRPTTLRGHMALVASVCAACFAAESLRGLDARSGMMPYGRLAPMLSLWSIACGTVAIAHKGSLASRINIWDMIAKQVLRVKCMGSEVQGRQLAETQWFRNGQKYLAQRQKQAPPVATVRR